MPKKALLVQLFVASPSDVTAEREQLEALVAEMNKVWRKSLGVFCELLRWETDVHPAFGSEQQAVINAQIGDEYDIFIGILWNRFGTRTACADSGTMEEFERAYLRRQKDGKPEIMVYFKDAPISPSKIDPTELLKVQKFKDSVSKRGGVYATFNDMDSFSSLLRVHLSAIVQQIVDQQSTSLTQPHPQILIDDAALSEPEEDLGYLDFMDQFESAMPELLTVLEEIGAATNKIGKDIAARTDEMLKAKNNPREVRKLIRSASDDMKAYADKLVH
jgi:hypothetical protein